MKMADRNLNDNMVKLVEYTIVTIERENEEILLTVPGASEPVPTMYLKVVTDDLSDGAFSLARIAEWVRKNPSTTLDEDSLQVYYNVLDRWPKQELKKDEALASIPGKLDVIAARLSGPTPMVSTNKDEAIKHINTLATRRQLNEIEDAELCGLRRKEVLTAIDERRLKL